MVGFGFFYPSYFFFPFFFPPSILWWFRPRSNGKIAGGGERRRHKFSGQYRKSFTYVELQYRPWQFFLNRYIMSYTYAAVAIPRISLHFVGIRCYLCSFFVLFFHSFKALQVLRLYEYVIRSDHACIRYASNYNRICNATKGKRRLKE